MYILILFSSKKFFVLATPPLLLLWLLKKKNKKNNIGADLAREDCGIGENGPKRNSQCPDHSTPDWADGDDDQGAPAGRQI